MLKSNARKIDPLLKKFASPWDTLIADAERKIQRHEQLIEELKRSINSFMEMRDQGVPFPRAELKRKRGRPPREALYGMK